MEENIAVGNAHKRVWFDKVSFVILLALVFLIPIFFVPASFISLQFGTSLLFAFSSILLILLYIISGLLSGSLDLPHPAKYILGFLSLVPIVYVLAGIANGFSRMSFFGYTFDINTVGFVVLAFIYMFFVSLTFRDKHRIFYSYFVFVISSLILSIFIIARIIFGAKFLAFGMFTDLTLTPIGTWNNAGIFFGIGAILSLLTYQMLPVSRVIKTILSLALLLSLVFLALVNFKVVWIILGICSFLFILYNIFNSNSVSFSSLPLQRKLRKIPLYPLIVFVLSVIFVIWGNSLGTYLATRLQVTNLEVRPSLTVTLEIAKNTIKSRPLFGSGPNTFVTEWLTYRPDDILSTVFWNTDFTNGIGLIPTFAVTTGIIGVLSWLVFLGFYVYLGIKSIFMKMEDSFVKYLLTSSFFISLYLWIMTFVYVPSTVIFILTFFFTGLFFASIYLSGLIKVKTTSFTFNPRTGFVSSLLMVILFFGGLTLAYGLFKNSQSLRYYQKSLYSLNTLKNISESEDYMVKAIASVGSDVYYRALSEIEIIKLNAILSQDSTKVKIEDIQKQFSDTLASAIKAGIASTEKDSSNYLNWIALGRVYEAVSAPELKVEGAFEGAQSAYTEALKRNPKNPGILILLARLSATHGDLKLARTYAIQAIALKKNYLDAYFLLTQVEVSDKNIKGAIDSATAASIIDPTNAAIFFQIGLLKYNIADYSGAIQVLEKATSMTPNYANAKYFLGLSYAALGERDKAIKEFEDLKLTNPDNTEIDKIISNIKLGRDPFANAETKKPEKGKTLPVKEKVQ